MKIITILYGALVLTGGIIGYVKAASLPSLAMGTLFGIALILSGFFMKKGRLACALSALLTIVFLIRFIKAPHLFPSGILGLASLAMVIALFCRIRTRR
jgi:uncharacterized membrane protein (UPF0136 family)